MKQQRIIRKLLRKRLISSSLPEKSSDEKVRKSKFSSLWQPTLRLVKRPALTNYKRVINGVSYARVVKKCRRDSTLMLLIYLLVTFLRKDNLFFISFQVVGEWVFLCLRPGVAILHSEREREREAHTSHIDHFTTSHAGRRQVNSSYFSLENASVNVVIYSPGM